MMMRKRLLLCGAMVIGLMLTAAPGSAQNGDLYYSGPDDPGPVGSYMCCYEGVPNIPPDQECILLHRVGEGEHMHVLAAYYYGDARAWRRIFKLNKNTIRNPNRIYEGQILKIAVPPCWVPRYDLGYFNYFMSLERERLEIRALGPKKGVDVVHKTEKIEAREEGPKITKGGGDESGKGPAVKPPSSETEPEPEPEPEPDPEPSGETGDDDGE